MADNIPSDENLAKLDKTFSNLKPESVAKFFEAMDRYTNTDIKTASKRVDEFATNIRKGRADYTRMGPVLKDLKESLEDFEEGTESLRDELKEYDKQIKEAGNNTQRVSEINAKRADVEKKLKDLGLVRADAEVKYSHHMRKMALEVAGSGVADALVNAATAFYKGTKEMVKRAVDGFQSGASGIDVATGIFTARMERDSSVVSGTFDAMGKAAGAVPGKLGFGVELASKLASKTEQERLELAKYSTEIISKDLKQLDSSFQQISKSGVLVTGGLTGLRASANAAGMRTEDWAKALTASAEAIKQSGLGVVSSQEILTKTSNELRTSNLGQQLRGMGISDVAEQTELAAETMRRLSTAGMSRAQIERNLGQETVKYTKELKVLSALTEGDAKQKLEAARRASLRAEVVSKLETPEQQAKFQSAMAVMSSVAPELQNGIMQLISTGATTDQALLTAMSQNQELRQTVMSTVSGIKDSSVTKEDFQKGLLQGINAAGATAKTSRNIQVIAGAGALTGDTTLTAQTGIQSGLINAQEFLKGKSIEEAFAATNDQIKQGGDKLKETVDQLAEQTNTAAHALEEFFTPQLKNAATNLVTELGRVKEPVDLLLSLAQKAAEMSAPSKRTDAENLKSAGSMGAGALTGAALGTMVAPVIGTAIGAAIGGAAGYFGYEFASKSKSGGKTEPAPDVPAPAGAATGAVFSGPKSGYRPNLEMHGKEAIIPLENLQSVMASAMVTGLSATAPKTDPVEEGLSSMGAMFRDAVNQISDLAAAKDKTQVKRAFESVEDQKFTGNADIMKLADKLSEQADLLRAQITINREISSRLNEHIGVSREILQVSR